MASRVLSSASLTNVLRPFRAFKPNRVKQERHFHPDHVAIMTAMKRRRKIAGPPPDSPRSTWLTWNRQAEIFAFGKRLSEEFSEQTLEIAFTHQSYIEKEEVKRRDLGVPEADIPLTLVDNSQLAREGENLMSRYIKAYLRHVYPRLPEEGICAVHDYLMSEDLLSHVSFNIGTGDLILCAEHPPKNQTLVDTLKAVIGAIQRDQNTQRAELFVQDFLLTQLVGKDIADLWEIPKPLAVLSSVLQNEGKAPPEPRLLWKAGCNTIFAVYHVGIYCNKELLGQGSGETVSTAVTISARDSLDKMFAVKSNLVTLPFGASGRNLQIDKNTENVPLSEWTSMHFEKRVKVKI